MTEVQCNDVLVVAESNEGQLRSTAFELLAIARDLVDETGGRVLAATLEPGDEARRLSAHGADRVFILDKQDFVNLYETEVWLHVADEILKQNGPAHILLANSPTGAECGPRLAFRLGTSIATGCESVQRVEGKIRITRPCFGNKAREVLVLQKDPAVVTVRARSHEALTPDPSREFDEVQLSLSIDESGFATRLVSRVAEEAEDDRLETARIIIAGGRGLGGPEGFKLLEELASSVGGAVGASRVACDLGWCPHSRQIGMSGKTVTPDLYVAVGISGASHHMAGCGTAKAILAINSDPDAAIFREARFGIVSDYKLIIPALIEALTEGDPCGVGN